MAVLQIGSQSALAQIKGCSYQKTGLTTTIQDLRDRLKKDPFAPAYDTYIHDLDVLNGDFNALISEADKIISDCASLDTRIQTYNDAIADYKASECGAATAPIEVVSRCQTRISVLQQTHTALTAQLGQLSTRWTQLVTHNDQLAQRAKPAIDHATLVLDPDNVEQALRLYTSFIQKNNSGNSCRDFSDIAERLGQRVQNQKYFLGYLVRNLSGGSRELDKLIPQASARPFVFDASGFLFKFYADETENQIRHTLAYMAVGYTFNGTAADLVAQLRDELKGEPQDYWLGVEAGHMGFQLRKGIYDTGNFGRAIRSRLCR